MLSHAVCLVAVRCGVVCRGALFGWMRSYFGLCMCLVVVFFVCQDVHTEASLDSPVTRHFCPGIITRRTPSKPNRIV